MSDPLKIVGVAMRHRESQKVFHQLGPATHTRLADLMDIHRLIEEPREWDKGFIASDGEFYDREDAFAIAKAAGQVKDSVDPNDPYLTSEDLHW